MMNKENKTLSLLYEVRMDALKKSRDAVASECVFDMIYYMKMLCWTLYEEGRLAVEIMAEKIEDIMPSDSNFKGKIFAAANIFATGYEADELIEILTSRYWANNYQGTEALMYYILILTLLKFYGGVSMGKLEDFLKAGLNDNVASEYEKSKKRFDENEVRRLFEGKAN